MVRRDSEYPPPPLPQTTRSQPCRCNHRANNVLARRPITETIKNQNEISPGHDYGQRRQYGPVRTAVLVEPRQRHELALVRGRRVDHRPVRALDGFRLGPPRRHAERGPQVAAAAAVYCEQAPRVWHAVQPLLFGRLTAHVRRLVRIVVPTVRCATAGDHVAASVTFARLFVLRAVPFAERYERLPGRGRVRPAVLVRRRRRRLRIDRCARGGRR